MRLLNRRQKTYNIRHYTGAVKDSEGNRTATYGEYEQISAEIFGATSQVQAEMYGERIYNIKNMLCSADTVINLKDRVTVDGIEYEVIGKEPYTMHVKVVLEKK